MAAAEQLEWVPLESGEKPSSSSPIAKALAWKKAKRPLAVNRMMVPLFGLAKVSTVVKGVVPGSRSRRLMVYVQA